MVWQNDYTQCQLYLYLSEIKTDLEIEIQRELDNNLKSLHMKNFITNMKSQLIFVTYCTSRPQNGCFYHKSRQKIDHQIMYQPTFSFRNIPRNPMKLLCEYLDNIIKHVILGMNNDSQILRNFSILAGNGAKLMLKETNCNVICQKCQILQIVKVILIEANGSN